MKQSKIYDAIAQIDKDIVRLKAENNKLKDTVKRQSGIIKALSASKLELQNYIAEIRSK